MSDELARRLRDLILRRQEETKGKAFVLPTEGAKAEAILCLRTDEPSRVARAIAGKCRSCSQDVWADPLILMAAPQAWLLCVQCLLAKEEGTLA